MHLCLQLTAKQIHSFLGASIACCCLRMWPHSPRDWEGCVSECMPSCVCVCVCRAHTCPETCNHSPIHVLVPKQIWISSSSSSPFGYSLITLLSGLMIGNPNSPQDLSRTQSSASPLLFLNNSVLPRTCTSLHSPESSCYSAVKSLAIKWTSACYQKKV